jgi:hypothetical protein
VRADDIVASGRTMLATVPSWKSDESTAAHGDRAGGSIA